MSARVLPMRRPAIGLLQLDLAHLARTEAAYRAAQERVGDAKTLAGMAILEGRLTQAQRHAVESAEQAMHAAGLDRDAAVSLLLGTWGGAHG